jgi:hypothetical protein
VLAAAQSDSRIYQHTHNTPQATSRGQRISIIIASQSAFYYSIMSELAICDDARKRYSQEVNAERMMNATLDGWERKF